MIRPFAFTDLDRILEIERQSFPKSPYHWSTFVHLYWFYPKTFWVSAGPVNGQKEERVCGYIVFSKDGHLISIAVDPLRRRTGIGKALVEKAVEITGARIIRAEVRRSNPNALAFYQAMGFRTAGAIPGYYGDEDALVVQLTPPAAIWPGDALTE